MPILRLSTCQPLPPPPISPTVGGGSSGGSGGGGGGFGNQLVGIGLSGTSAFMDGNGKSLTAGQISTPDGKLTLRIPVGTYIWNAAGAAQAFISASVMITPPPVPPQNSLLLAYEMGPNGVTFTPAITLVMTYSDAELPSSTKEGELYITWWNGTEWVKLESTVDTTANTVSAQVSHFTGLAMMVPVAPQLPTPILKINTPSLGASFDIGNVTISIGVENLNLVQATKPNIPGEGHIIYYLDVAIPTTPGKSALTATGTYLESQISSQTWTNLVPGVHNLGVQLVQNDNTPFDPPIYSALNVSVSPPAIPTTILHLPATKIAPVGGQLGTDGFKLIVFTGVFLVLAMLLFIFYRSRRYPKLAQQSLPVTTLGRMPPVAEDDSKSMVKALAFQTFVQGPIKHEALGDNTDQLGFLSDAPEEAGEYIIRLHNVGTAVLGELRNYIRRNTNIKLLTLNNFNTDVQFNIRLEKPMYLVKVLSDDFKPIRVRRTGQIILINQEA